MDHARGLFELLGGLATIVVILGGLALVWLVGMAAYYYLMQFLIFFFKRLLGPLVMLAGVGVIIAEGKTGGGWAVGLFLIAYGGLVLTDWDDN